MARDTAGKKENGDSASSKSAGGNGANASGNSASNNDVNASSNSAGNASGNSASASEVVRLSSRLERAVDAVDHILASGKNVTLDFSDCEFVTVDGLEWLEEILLRSESLKSTVTFVKLKPKLYKVFKVAHIDSLQKACGAPGPAMGPVC
jgi:hypothetical protein